MNFIPSALLEKLYTRKSLENNATGFQFKIKNRLSNAQLTEVLSAKVGEKIITPKEVSLDFGGGKVVDPQEIKEPIAFSLGQEFTVKVEGEALAAGDYNVELNFVTQPVGKLSLKIKDKIEE